MLIKKYFNKKYFLILFIALSIIARLLSFIYNQIPHGDIFLDYSNAYMLKSTGKMITPVITPRGYEYDVNTNNGYPLDQHPPLWPILGAVVFCAGIDPFLAFKIISFLCGILILFLSYLTLRTYLDQEFALIACAFLSWIYVLIDFSANGSLYMLQALLYILSVLLVWRIEKRSTTFLLPLVMVCAYLINYQAICIGLSVFVFLIIKIIKDKRKEYLFKILIMLGFSLVLAMPWLVRNFIVFGKPLYNVNSLYIFARLGAKKQYVLKENHYLINYVWINFNFLAAARKIFLWFGKNLVYLLARIQVIVPLVGTLGIWGFLQIFRKKIDKPDIIKYSIILILLHVVISCLMPVFKFRYFVPLVPLTVLLGFWSLNLKVLINEKIKKYILWSSIVLLFTVNILTFIKVPTHTNYFDSNELVHYRTGEKEWYKKALLYKDAAEKIEGLQGNYVLTTNIAGFYYFHKTIINPGSISKEIINYYLDTFKVEYLILEKKQMELYTENRQIKNIYENEKYAVYQYLYKN